jgi:hypothetical protein
MRGSPTKVVTEAESPDDLLHKAKKKPGSLSRSRERTGDLSIEPIFFRINIASMSGLRGMAEAG